jgi:hypothetical protein
MKPRFQSFVNSLVINKMKLFSGVFLLLIIQTVKSGGDNLCGNFTSSVISLQQEFDIASKLLQENSFAMLGTIFDNVSLTKKEKQDKITTFMDQSKQVFQNLEDEVYKKLGTLIGKDPDIIARKLLHAFDVTEFPFVCVMKDADYISFRSNIIAKSVNDYANKIYAEL